MRHAGDARIVVADGLLALPSELVVCQFDSRDEIAQTVLDSFKFREVGGIIFVSRIRPDAQLRESFNVLLSKKRKPTNGRARPKSNDCSKGAT